VWKENQHTYTPTHSQTAEILFVSISRKQDSGTIGVGEKLDVKGEPSNHLALTWGSDSQLSRDKLWGAESFWVSRRRHFESCSR